MQFGNLLALSALLLAPFASAVPLDSETSPVSVLQKRSHGDCGADPRCSVSQGQAIQDLVKQTFRDGFNYNHLVQRTSGNNVIAYACDNFYPARLGQVIRNMFTDGLYGKAGCKACGYWYLDDAAGCKVKADYCIGCPSIG
ncbi:hypothetical protein EJ07DRAFT_158947 [Lizonia empirigonia]|nr:hypothetical protein EJ07DRAFT_158947 [Lizonia empirigonia]